MIIKFFTFLKDFIKGSWYLAINKAGARDMFKQLIKEEEQKDKTD